MGNILGVVAHSLYIAKEAVHFLLGCIYITGLSLHTICNIGNGFCYIGSSFGRLVGASSKLLRGGCHLLGNRTHVFNQVVKMFLHGVERSSQFTKFIVVLNLQICYSQIAICQGKSMIP